MAKLVWDAQTDRIYETGVDRGVLYVQGADAKYENGVAWNGLTAITESPTGAEATALYADNQKYLNLLSAEEFEATIEAYTFPAEFEACDGFGSVATGVTIGQQARSTFGLSYRTIVGNAVEGSAYGYKIHLIYGAVASPSEKAFATVNDSPDAITFSWDVSTTPVEATLDGDSTTTASLVIDSTKVDATMLAAFEAVLYGTDGDEGTSPRMPLPTEVATMFTATETASASTPVGTID